ncbi:MAG TPA: dihydrolipoyllysine-residue acetyltransferase, partial [Marinagarivorans sp.]|nr:dihydrolipoyllysine-residue acetyltransferase [Marinagarivorans sp.]
MAIETIKVPDIGGAEGVEVIEVCVKPGDSVSAEQSLIVLESDKASMEVPSPKAGKVVSVLIKVGDKASEGTAVIELEVAGAAAAPAPAAAAAPAAAPAASAPAASAELAVAVPDIGGAEGVDVIEVCVKVGDQVKEGDSLIVLESDKASMEVPSPASGTVLSLAIKVGDKASQGTPVLVLASGAAPVAPAPTAAPAPVAAAAGPVAVAVPDIGGAEGVEVIEVCVKAGDEVKEGDSLIVLESDKASMEVPSPASGKVISLAIKVGDKASQGTPILQLAVAGAAPAAAPTPAASAPASKPAPVASSLAPQASAPVAAETRGASSDYYAGPSVRMLARQLGVNLAEVKASGPRGRIVKDDVKAFVKAVMENRGKAPAGGSAVSGVGIPQVPEIDFSQFGPIELVKMSKIKKLTAANMTRNWLNVPAVTQFDDADITEIEAFRKSIKDEAEKSGVKLTPLPFLIKAVAAALRAEPTFNVSMHADGEHIVQKDYVHIGMAVDTPNGLMVPVIRDADKKGIYQIAQESNALAKKAREGKLTPKEMQGGCFTISSLGAIGGKGFTPIVNCPEVAILGVSRAETKPVWNGKEFAPRFMLPLSLTYDHRAINGGDAG